MIDGLFFRTNIFEILIIYLGNFLETYTCIILVRKNINPRSRVNKHTSKHTSKHTWKHIYIYMTTEMKVHVVTLQVCFKVCFQVCFQVCLLVIEGLYSSVQV